MKTLVYDITKKVDARLVVHAFLEKQDPILRVSMMADETSVTFLRTNLNPGGYDVTKMIVGKVLDFRVSTTQTVWTLSHQDVYNVAKVIQSGQYDETKIWEKFNNKFQVK